MDCPPLNSISILVRKTLFVCLMVFAFSLSWGQDINWAKLLKEECEISAGSTSTDPGLLNYFHLHRHLENKEVDEAMPLLLYCVNHLEQYSEKQQFYLLVVLSNIYLDKGLVEKVYEIQQKGLEIGGQSDVQTASVFANTGHYLFKTEKFEEALKVYAKVLDQGAVQQDSVLYGRILNNMGICYFNKDNPDYLLADSSLQLALNLAEQQRDTLQICQVQTNIADLLFDQYRDAEAEALWLKMAQLAEEKGYLNEQEIIYSNLAFLYQEGGQWKNALACSQKQNELQKAMWDRDQLWKQAETEKKYELDLKQSQLDLKQSQLDLVSSENQRKTQQRNAFIVISILVLAIGLVFLWLYRSKRKANVLMTAKNQELTELNTTKDKLFSIISHDLRSPILSLKNRSSRMVKKLGGDEQPEALKMAKANQNSLHNMHQLIENVLSWGTSQQEKREANFQKLEVARVVDMVAADYEGLMEDKSLSLTVELKSRAFVWADLHNVKAVLRNVFDNAIKNNLENGGIRITFDHSANALLIENDGPSIRMEIVEQLRSGQRGKHLASSGLGLWICKDLMELNQGNFDIHPVENGTRVAITFKTMPDE